MSQPSERVKANTESQFAQFVIHWDKDMTKQEASVVVEAAKELLPVFDQAREFVHTNDQNRIRAWMRIGYPYIDPYLDFEVWYDEVAKGYGIHIFGHLTWNCYGSIHFRHQRN